MTTMTDTLPTGISAAQALQSHVLLLAPTMGYWKGQYQIRDADVMVGTEKVERTKATRPQTKLLESSPWTKSWQKQFMDLDNERHTIVHAMSSSFPLRGVRQIPRAVAGKVFNQLIGHTDDKGNPVYDSSQEIQSLAYRLHTAADDFVDQYDRLLQEIKDNQPESIWRHAQHQIPKRSEMRSKFYLDVLPVELAGSSGGSITRGDLERYSNQIQQSTMRMVNEAVEEMIAGPRDELAKAIESLHGLISRDGHVSDRSFNGVRAAISKIQLFSFVATDDLLGKIHELEVRVGNTDAASLNHATATNNGLLTALAAVQEEVTSELHRAADVRRFGQNLRGFGS
jgi:hypothetical protein